MGIFFYHVIMRDEPAIMQLGFDQTRRPLDDWIKALGLTECRCHSKQAPRSSLVLIRPFGSAAILNPD